MTATDANAMMSVPVLLIEAYLRSSDAERWPQMADAFRRHLPDPEPRFVAVDINSLRIHAGESDIVEQVSALPDLLEILDGAVSEYVGSPSGAESLKAHIRAALVAAK